MPRLTLTQMYTYFGAFTQITIDIPFPHFLIIWIQGRGSFLSYA